MKQVIVITGASSGFGALSARSLALAGNIVYAGMRETMQRNRPQVLAAQEFAQTNQVQLLPIELDVNSETSIQAAVDQVIAEQGQLDVIMHNAGHMVVGPAEAFTPAQVAELYDINVISTQRVNRIVLPLLRKQQHGLVLWVSSSSVKGGTPPYLAPYFAAKAGMDALAVSYAAELKRFGVETSIIVPGSFTSGTNHFQHAGHPADDAVAAEYDSKYPNLMQQVGEKLAQLAPSDSSAQLVADEVVKIVSTPAGQRPYRVHVDPADDGSEKVSDVADTNRAAFLERIGLADLI
ncbi:SDR family oxidoreductase [Lactobacillus sp. UCMA15818]|uniref:SDR family oxidoreductase n=1 Tax=Lactobacillus sp. UCMA15818 TaxID=2583394 RepID=UPI0025B18BD0|nr:SDR family oxidoreductase [Lactobacillus sp. UCMA15818]MDN2454179.1 SDR family oxidoreductase [Lactobacillus sp. UCMA15818]